MKFKIWQKVRMVNSVHTISDYMKDGFYYQTNCDGKWHELIHEDDLEEIPEIDWDKINLDWNSSGMINRMDVESMRKSFSFFKEQVEKQLEGKV